VFKIYFYRCGVCLRNGALQRLPFFTLYVRASQSGGFFGSVELEVCAILFLLGKVVLQWCRMTSSF